MTTTFPDTALTPQPPSFGFSEFGTALLEPLLVVGAALFWLVALPFVALSLMLVKIWDTLVALKMGTLAQANPLILRSSAPKTVPVLSEGKSAKTAQI